MPINKKLTKNISLHELLYSDDDSFNNFVDSNLTWNVEFELIKTAQTLQIIRDYFDKPLIITSGYRPAVWEKIQGRSGRSQHVFGKAADFYLQDVAIEDVYQFVQDTFKSGGRSLYLAEEFIHLDTRDEFVTW